MLAQNVVNPSKKGKILGRVFHVYYPDETTSLLFDSDFTQPIIWGAKNVVMTRLKKIDGLMEIADEETKVTIYSYKLTSDGYKRVHTYSGPIGTIGKYVVVP